jgi:hypothetical protein
MNILHFACLNWYIECERLAIVSSRATGKVTEFLEIYLLRKGGTSLEIVTFSYDRVCRLATEGWG